MKVKKTAVVDTLTARMLKEQADRAGVSESALMAEILDGELFRRACERYASRRKTRENMSAR